MRMSDMIEEFIKELFEEENKIEIQRNKNQNSHANCRHQYIQCCKLPLQTDGNNGN